MTTITLSRVRNQSGGRLASLRGFTLVEMMIGATISSFVLAAVLTTFLFMGRSGANVQNYNDMEVQARSALEFFAEDTRQASGVVWNSTTSVTLTVITNSITYSFDSTTKKFTRTVVVTATGTQTSSRVLVTGITSFAFSAYNISATNVPISTAAERTAANGTTKQLQISLEAARTNTTVVAATNTVLSARFILRNKKVTA
jgi:prepilin-type N-terminal cleavage/methylation domain-containing protein